MGKTFEELTGLDFIGNEERERQIKERELFEKLEYKDIRENVYVLILSKKKDEATELIVRKILTDNHIYTTKDDEKSEIWIYRDGIYIPQGRSEIKEICRKILQDAYNTIFANQVIAKIETDTFIEKEKFFNMQYKDEVPVKNGILNIFSGEITAFDPKKIFFNKMPVTFNPSSKCPKIEKFLKEVLSKEEDIKVFYELVGFGLLKEYKYEKAFMFVGGGRNGKGKTILLLKRLFGDANCCSLPLSSLCSDSFRLSELFGKTLNLAGDIGSGDLKDTSMFKSATGRDLIGGRRKFLKDIFFENYAKFVFACNDLPMVYDMSLGFWDRWILLDFPYTFVTREEYEKSPENTMLKIKDDEIISKICDEEELSGLLNEGLAHLRKLEKNKRFSSTRGSEEVKSMWIRRSNSFIAFCWDMIEDEYDGRITKKELRKKYAEYCKKHKIPPKSDFVIKKVLQETYGASELRNEERLGDSYIRMDSWEGIKWKCQDRHTI